MFAPGANGNVAPIRQITNVGPIAGNTACTSMVFDPTGQFLILACGTEFVRHSRHNQRPGYDSVPSSLTSAAISRAQWPSIRVGNFYITDTFANSVDFYTGPISDVGWLSHELSGGIDGWCHQLAGNNRRHYNSSSTTAGRCSPRWLIRTRLGAHPMQAPNSRFGRRKPSATTATPVQRSPAAVHQPARSVRHHVGFRRNDLRDEPVHRRRQLNSPRRRSPLREWVRTTLLSCERSATRRARAFPIGMAIGP